MSVLRALMLAAFLTAALASGPGVTAQEGPSLWVDPADHTAGMADGAFDLAIMVDDVPGPDGLGGYSLLASYDPAVVHALSVTDGGFVMNTENAVACPASGIDNDAGSVALYCLTIPLFVEAGAATSEPQVLARVTFSPVGEGSSEIDIGDSLLTDPSGNGIISSNISGTVTVVAGSIGPSTSGPSTEDGSSEGPHPTGDAAAVTGAGGQSGTVDSASEGLPKSGVGPARGESDAWVRGAMALAVVGSALLLAGELLRRREARRMSP